MKKRNFTYLPSIDFPEQMNIRLAVWRKINEKDSKIFLNIVDYANLQLGDILFCDHSNFCGYVKLVDFVRNSDGTVSDYITEDINIDMDKSVLMAKTTKQAVTTYLRSTEDEKACVVISLKNKEQNNGPE